MLSLSILSIWRTTLSQQYRQMDTGKVCHYRRPDIILIFINGMPLVFIERKIALLGRNLQQNLKDYMKIFQISLHLVRFIVLSNGLETQAGTSMQAMTISLNGSRLTVKRKNQIEAILSADSARINSSRDILLMVFLRKID